MVLCFSLTACTFSSKSLLFQAALCGRSSLPQVPAYGQKADSYFTYKNTLSRLKRSLLRGQNRGVGTSADNLRTDIWPGDRGWVQGSVDIFVWKHTSFLIGRVQGVKPIHFFRNPVTKTRLKLNIAYHRTRLKLSISVYEPIHKQIHFFITRKKILIVQVCS